MFAILVEPVCSSALDMYLFLANDNTCAMMLEGSSSLEVGASSDAPASRLFPATRFLRVCGDVIGRYGSGADSTVPTRR